MTKNLTCIICPRGCALTAEIAGEQVTVSGFACRRGEEYAVNECLHPMRTVTATIRVANRPDTMAAVKTRETVAKADMMAVMERLRSLQVTAPIRIGDVLVQGVCGTDIVATKDVE